MKNAINWFEIPSTDFERATAFYNTILGAPLRVEAQNGIPNAVFPYSGHDQNAVGGSVIYNLSVKPSPDGVVPYINVTGVMDAVLARVESAGGTVLMPKTDTGIGSIAMILDTEGNRVGLHTF
jgi:predicted enzyme related to lactoylglutathione lyase